MKSFLPVAQAKNLGIILASSFLLTPTSHASENPLGFIFKLNPQLQHSSPPLLPHPRLSHHLLPPGLLQWPPNRFPCSSLTVTYLVSTQQPECYFTKRIQPGFPSVRNPVVAPHLRSMLTLELLPDLTPDYSHVLLPLTTQLQPLWPPRCSWELLGTLPS